MRRVQHTDRHVAEGLHAGRDVRPWDATARAHRNLVVHVAAFGEAGVQEAELRVAPVLAEFGVEDIHGGVEFRRRGVEQSNDAGVVACAERVRGGVGIDREVLHSRGVLELVLSVRRPALHHHGEYRVLRLAPEWGNLDEVFLGKSWGWCGGSGGGCEGRESGEEKEQAGHGFKPPERSELSLNPRKGGLIVAENCEKVNLRVGYG